MCLDVVTWYIVETADQFLEGEVPSSVCVQAAFVVHSFHRNTNIREKLFSCCFIAYEKTSYDNSDNKVTDTGWVTRI
jgi:hypothetical protein